MDAYFEYAGVAFGVIYVLLAARGNVWCWPAGVISSALYIYINVYHRLFQDAILQSYYVAAGFYGWWLWVQKGKQHDEAGFVSFSLQKNFKLIFFGALLVPVFGFIFSKFGNALSYFDASVTVFSFIATWMTAKKIIENWLFWIVIDVVAAAMYFIKGLHATSVLYLFFSAVSVYGYLQWRKQMQTT
jgi:nicotinamide mononucleotide transporter